MAITPVGSTEITYATTPGTLSRDDVINIGTRTNGALIVYVNVIGVQTAGDPLSLTWNGVSLTKVVETGGQPFSSDIWYLPNLASGSQHLITSFSGGSSPNGATVYHIVVQWVDSDNDVESADIATLAASGDPTSIDLDTTAPGALCVSAYVTADNNIASTSDTLLQDWDQGGNCSGVNYLIAGSPGTYTLHWDRGAGQTAPFNIAAAVFQEVDAGSSPVVALDTANATEFDTDTPSLLFTGTDADADDIRYNVQIADNDGFLDGEQLEDAWEDVTGTIIHPNALTSTYTWQDTGSGQRYRQVDDRPGQAFTGAGGKVTGISVKIGRDTIGPTAGYARILLYNEAHTTAFGTDSTPENPADPADTPTPGWIAESDWIYIDTSKPLDPEWTVFAFTGTDQVRLAEGAYYVFIIDWLPDTDSYDNTIRIQAGTTGHAGNLYIDGAGANNGVYAPNDLTFRVYETFGLLDKTSGTDAGFANVDNGADTDPFTSGDQISYTVQAGDALEFDTTYYWRVRGGDPSGTNTYGDWTAARTFTATESGSVTVTLAAATQAQTANQVAITQAQAVAMGGTTNGQAAGVAVVTQQQNVTLASVVQTQSSGAVSVTQVGQVQSVVLLHTEHVVLSGSVVVEEYVFELTPGETVYRPARRMTNRSDERNVYNSKRRRTIHQ